MMQSKNKLILFIIFSILLVGMAVIIWAVQKNKINISAAEINQIDSAKIANENLVFSNTYRDGGKLVMQIGYFQFNSNGSGAMHYFYYFPSDNNEPGVTSIQHNKMDVPAGYGKSGCTSAGIMIPGYKGYNDVNFSWIINGMELKITAGSVVYNWLLIDNGKNLFKLNGMSGYSDPLGYGFISNQAISQTNIGKNNLFDSYSGEFWSYNWGNSTWSNISDSLNINLFSTKNDSNVLGYTYYCPYTQSGTTYNTYCQSTVLLNYAPYTKLFIYLNGGHDYNLDCCFNDYGHTTQLFGVMEGSKVTKMVRLEYTYQTSGQPILGIGYFYSPQATNSSSLLVNITPTPSPTPSKTTSPAPTLTSTPTFSPTTSATSTPTSSATMPPTYAPTAISTPLLPTPPSPTATVASSPTSTPTPTYTKSVVPSPTSTITPAPTKNLATTLSKQLNNIKVLASTGQSLWFNLIAAGVIITIAGVIIFR